ncbi:MAG TPA: nucleotidyltransferase family protein [Bryobacteraceae bacterium]|nr:nucleotidyltransferase family protein [Bryobacteraceae bacterium]
MRHDSPYYNFLASILSGVAPDTKVCARPDWDWEEFIRIAADETVVPTVSARLGELDIRELLPREVSDFFAAYAELNAERNQKIIDEIEEIAALLNRTGIEPMVLKGASYLLTKVYENPAHRFILDIDCMFRKRGLKMRFQF